MRRTLGAALAAALVTSLSATAVAGASPTSGTPDANGVVRGDVRELPQMAQRLNAQRARAADLVARNLATPAGHGLAELADGTLVPYGTLETAHIVTVLAEFSDLAHDNLDAPPQDDNITYVPGDTEPSHYEDMLFSTDGVNSSYGFPSMREFYLELSSGAFTVDGDVSGWVVLPETQEFYGENSRRNGPGSDDQNGPVYRIVRDAVATAPSGVDWSPGTVDVWDRYDCDGDGKYLEPDGYVDHFQLVHSGPGEEAGADPNTIWSHRWYANFNLTSGPEACQFGGYPVGDTGLWIGDYTIEPEDGGVGVFAHEFAHDLGLPDLYDTTGGAENGTGFWTLMSSGSWASADPNAIGTDPVQMGVWEKEFLGWLDVETVDIDDLSDTPTLVTLGPAERDDDASAQALRVNVDMVDQVVDLWDVRRRSSDNTYLWSGRGDSLNNTLRSTFDPLVADQELTFWTIYDIETDYDYGYVEVRDGGGTWAPVPVGRITDASAGNGITGTARRWTSHSVTVPEGSTGVGFRYYTDVAWVQDGLALDDVALGGNPVAWDDLGAEDGGFRTVTDGTVIEQVQPYYLVASRSHYLNDINLCGAYNWIGAVTVEKICYAPGLLVTYVNPEHVDNNVSQHPGAGLALPVDLHPQTLVNALGTPLRSRLQVWDAAASLDGWEETLTTVWSERVRGQIVSHQDETDYTSPALADPFTVFDDHSTDAYWNPALPYSTIHTAGSGLQIGVTGVSDSHRTFELALTRGVVAAAAAAEDTNGGQPAHAAANAAAGAAHAALGAEHAAAGGANAAAGAEQAATAQAAHDSWAAAASHAAAQAAAGRAGGVQP